MHPSAFLSLADLWCIGGRPYDAKTEWGIANALCLKKEGRLPLPSDSCHRYASVWNVVLSLGYCQFPKISSISYIAVTLPTSLPIRSILT